MISATRTTSTVTVLSVLGLVVTGTLSVDAQFTSCSICPVGQALTLPDAAATNIDFGVSTCSGVEELAQQGYFTPDFCDDFGVLLADNCGCMEVTAVPTGSPPTTPFPVAPTAPISAPLPPSPGFPPCSVCGPGSEVTLPDVMITNFFGGSPLTCLEFQSAGRLGYLDPAICAGVASFVSSCGCS